MKIADENNNLLQDLLVGRKKHIEDRQTLEQVIILVGYGQRLIP